MSDQSPDFAAMAAPTEEHAMLGPFVGTFSTLVKVWMGPGKPLEMTGTMVNAFDLGGRFLKQTYVADASDGPFPAFEGRGYWGYNKIDATWESVWLDSASTALQVERGTVDDAGTVWTLAGEMTDPGSGKPLRKRSIITLVDSDHHRLEMYFETPDGEAKGMEISYTRTAD